MNKRIPAEPGTNSLNSPLPGVREALVRAIERMDRARDILTDGKPTPVCNWGMLATEDLRAALSQGTSQAAAPTESQRAALQELADLGQEMGEYGGLSDERIIELWDEYTKTIYPFQDNGVAFARAILAEAGTTQEKT